MKKILTSLLLCVPMLVNAQAATDAYTLSQTDLKGTARYMSMAGAFGALGGDLTAVNKNPGGIGVYRSSDVGITLNLDLQTVDASSQGLATKTSQTKFNCSNFGYVGALRLSSETMPFINWGFSYNRPVSYNRKYSGKIDNINSSLSNYIATVTNRQGYTSYDLAFEEAANGDVIYDPYIDSYAPWLSIMAYNSFIMNPGIYDTNGVGHEFRGLMNAKTLGFSEYEVVEKGGIDEFNVNFGGNVADKLYWGFAFGIDNMSFSKYTYYGEGLTDATVAANDNGALDNNGSASYGLENWLNTSGNGWNFKLGVIYKPINELRLGLAFHTPTYWALTDEAYSVMNFETISSSNDFIASGTEESNAGYVDEVDYRVQTPWKVNASAATVIGGKAIVSLEYERVAYNDMNVEYGNGYGSYSENKEITNSIKEYYKAMNIFRIGAEYRLSPKVSLRLGYAYQSSPVNENALNGSTEIITAGTMPSYSFDKSTQYVTGGLGYRSGGFYTDLAYVYKMRTSEYSAYSPYDDNVGGYIQAPNATIKDKNSQLVWSIGYRF